MKETYLRSTNQRRTQMVMAELLSSRASILALNFELRLLLQLALHSYMISLNHSQVWGASRRLRLDTSAYGRKWYYQSRWLPKLQLIKRPPAARVHPAKNQQLNVTPHVTTWDPKCILAIVWELFRASIATESSSYPTWGSFHLLNEVVDCRGTVHTTVGNFWQKRAEWYKCLHKAFVFWNVVVWGIVIL